jgi:hypothetical protein
MIVLHDTHHRCGYRCHMLKAGDVRLVEREGGVPPHGNAKIEDYEMWRVAFINKRERFFIEERGSEARRIEWRAPWNVITILVEGPDALYASTEELKAEGWAIAKSDWGVS